MKTFFYIVFTATLLNIATPRVRLPKKLDLTNTTCVLYDFADQGHCWSSNSKNELVCRRGFTQEWMKQIQYNIHHLKILDWPWECLNVGKIQLHFPELRVLQILNSSTLSFFKGHFDSSSKIEPMNRLLPDIGLSKITQMHKRQTLLLSWRTYPASLDIEKYWLTSTDYSEMYRKLQRIHIHGMLSLWEVPPEVVIQMPLLQELDLRNNVLRHMKARLLKGPPALKIVRLGDNKWDCSDGGLDWLAMEKEDSVVRRKIVDYNHLMCHQKLYRGKPLHKVMAIIKTVRLTCPEPCECAMTHVVSDRAGTIIPLITVDCSSRHLVTPPMTLPPGTTVLKLHNNKIDSIRMVVLNPEYQGIADLYLDNNSISTVKELESSEWLSSFRLLSLRGNQLKQIPVYAFDKAFQKNKNIVNVFLSNNPWRCDCHFLPRFQNFLLKYRRVLKDLPDIQCARSEEKISSLMQIVSIRPGSVCSENEFTMIISPLNILNLFLLTLILLVIGRFLYDWHSFRTTGRLPWISSIMP